MKKNKAYWVTNWWLSFWFKFRLWKCKTFHKSWLSSGEEDLKMCKKCKLVYFNSGE